MKCTAPSRIKKRLGDGSRQDSVFSNQSISAAVKGLANEASQRPVPSPPAATRQLRLSTRAGIGRASFDSMASMSLSESKGPASFRGRRPKTGLLECPRTMPDTASSTPPRRRSRKTRYLVLAIFWFVVGVIGVLLPVVPQVPFFVMSLLYLSLMSQCIHRSVRRFLHRHPKAEASYHRWRHKRRRRRVERAAANKKKKAEGRRQKAG